jgi:O-antigen ligase
MFTRPPCRPRARFYRSFAPNVRFAAFLLVAQLVVLLLIGWLYLGDFATVLNFLGKDGTMTARTWVSEWTDMVTKERPMLGFGYQAYWQPGNWGARRNLVPLSNG